MRTRSSTRRLPLRPSIGDGPGTTGCGQEGTSEGRLGLLPRLTPVISKRQSHPIKRDFTQATCALVKYCSGVRSQSGGRPFCSQDTDHMTTVSRSSHARVTRA
jgi:hypothetical protein